MNRRTPPFKGRSGATGAFSGPSPVERALEQLGPPSDVLTAHGYRVRRRMSACPACDGGHRTPCLSLFKGSDGRERWKCHSCQAGGDSLDLKAAITGRSIRELVVR